MQEVIISQDKQKNKIVALVENGKLVEKYEERPEQKRLEGNIYLGKVENVLVGMQAAFVDIGVEKNTFIHIKDIIPKVSNETGNKNETLSKYNIKNYIHTGMPILVQVKRDSTNKKGARVSTHITIPGRFVVLMPNSEFITISKKIEKDQERKRLTDLAKSVLSQGFGLIIRTSAEGKEKELIQKDIEGVIQQYNEIIKKAKTLEKSSNFNPVALYSNNGIVEKILTDIIDQDLQRIITNNVEINKYVQKFLQDTRLESKVKLELKQNENVLNIYDIEDQIEKSNNRKIWLKCGGFITIDKTEALTAIDVNSGKYVGSKDLEQTVFTVNKEATIEIAKQLRLRDIGGIIIIDYIDMEKKETKQKILEILEEHVKKDRSKIQIVGFTPRGSKHNNMHKHARGENIMKKRVIALTMAALMAASLTACGGSAKETTAAAAADTTAAAKEESTAAESTAAESKEAAGGKLVMATNAEFPPYEFHDGDKIVGIDAEIAQAIADELGMELEIEDIAFDSIIPEIVSGKADMALAGMTVTEDRKASVDFSDTYATASQMIIVKEDSEIAGPDDLKGVTVGVQLGTTGDIYVSDLEADGTTVERYNKGFEAVQALSQGKIDAVVIDGEPAKTFVSETEGLKILDEAFTVEEYAIAVKKGNTELLDKVNGALETLKDNGTLDEIVAKYIKAE